MSLKSASAAGSRSAAAAGGRSKGGFVAVAVAVAAGGYLLYRLKYQRQASSGAPKASPKTPAQLQLDAFVASTVNDEKVHLFTFPVMAELSPSFTPYGVRVETYMRMHKIPYEKHTDGSPAASPNGCVPYICYKGKLLADSTLINDFLESEFHIKAGSSADTEIDHALVSAVRAVVTYSMVPAFMRSVFYADPGRRIYRYLVASLGLVSEGNPFSCALRFVAAKVFRYILHSRFTTTGFLLLDKEQYEELFLRDLESVESLLVESPYIAGGHFTTADAALYALLLPLVNLFHAEKRRLMATKPFKGADEGDAVARNALLDAIYINDTLQYVYESEVLQAYVERISKEAFPDMAEILRGPAILTATDHQ